jgi:hypothetical protein
LAAVVQKEIEMREEKERQFKGRGIALYGGQDAVRLPTLLR